MKTSTSITDRQACVSFTMDEFDSHHAVKWDMYTYNSNDEEDQFGMIIGEELIARLGIKLDCKLMRIR